MAYGKFYPVKTSPVWQIELTKVANCVLTDNAFLIEIATIPKFDYSNATGLEVSLSLQKNVNAYLATYKPKFYNRYSKVIAYRNSNSNIIHFNILKNPREVDKMVNTCIHEILHIHKYHHNGNGPENEGRQFTVNYYVGRLAEKYVKDCL